MKNMARKFLLLFTVVLVLSSLLSVSASALSVDDVTGAITKQTDQIKAQFDVINDLVKGFLGNWQDYVNLALVLLLLIECFFGYKLLGAQLFLAGAYLGIAGGLYVYELLAKSINMPQGSEEIIKWIIAAVIAIIMALLLCALKRVGMIIFIGAYSFIQLGAYTDGNLIVRTAITALIVVLCIFFLKYLFIGVTAYLSGVKSMELLFGSFLLKNFDLGKYIVNTPKAPVFYIGLLVAFLGMYVQYKMLKKKTY